MFRSFSPYHIPWGCSYYSTQYSNYYMCYLMMTKDCRPRLLLTVPQVTQKNFSKIKCCEVWFIPPENFTSWGCPNVLSQHCCMAGKGKVLKYDSPSVGALCITFTWEQIPYKCISFGARIVQSILFLGYKMGDVGL